MYKRMAAVLCMALFTGISVAQMPFSLKDGRDDGYCTYCRNMESQKPREVLMGIHIQHNGDIYFSITNTEWFDKIFPAENYGITTDLVVKERYDCAKPSIKAGLPRGTMLFPVYRKDLLKGKDKPTSGKLYVKIGKLPAHLKGKQVEGSLVIVNGNLVCYYTSFVNIDRNAWQLLPMGMYTGADSLLKNINTGKETYTGSLTYTRKIQLEIPFEKNSGQAGVAQMRMLYDSLNLAAYHLRKIEVRAYASVEGTEAANKILMNRRAEAVLGALKKQNISPGRIKLIAAENWLEFYRDVEQTGPEELNQRAKDEVKRLLTDPVIRKKAEPMLARHRKVVITLYTEEKSELSSYAGKELLSGFSRALSDSNLTRARNILREIAERVADNNLPSDYMYQLEIPQQVQYMGLLNDREVFKYQLHLTGEFEALEELLEIHKLDPQNVRVLYNICALRFFEWQYGEAGKWSNPLKDIQELENRGIHRSLVKRMRINYYILKSEEDLLAFRYDAKDSAVDKVRELYAAVPQNDEDIYSMARYFGYHSQFGWAEDIITPRIDKIDVSEDLLFYYINLLFFSSENYETEEFKKAVMNAVNLNRKRFCDFFLPFDGNGAGMQLLEEDALRSLYCESCK